MLRFVEHENFRSDKKMPLIIMEYDGFDIPVIEDYPELASFNVRTYLTFIKNTSNMAYGPINMFLKTLTLEDQHEVASAFVEMNSIVRTLATDMHDVDLIVDNCSEIITELDKGIDLCGKLYDFTIKCVNDGIFPMADMSTAGSRPHDRKDMTFIQDEAVTVIAMTMLSKLLSPVIGEFINRFTGMLGDFKETKIAGIFTEVYQRRYPVISKKLNFYISNLVEAKDRNDPSIHLAGVTSNSTTIRVEASLKTKKFPMVDNNQPDGSIIKYIASCIRSFIDNQMSSHQNAMNTKMHNDPKDENAVASNEETNFSRMEKQSRSSKFPLAKEPLAAATAEDIIKWLIIDGVLDKELYERSLNWYKKNPMIITHIGLLLAITYFGKDMGGGKTMYVLDKEYLFKLMIALQLVLIKKGHLYLAHACTMEESRDNREITQQDAVFNTMWKSTPVYTMCKKAMSGGFGDVQWDVGIRTIVQCLLTKTYSVHIAPFLIEDFLKLETMSPENGTKLVNRVEFVEELMIFIHEVWQEANALKD